MTAQVYFSAHAQNCPVSTPRAHISFQPCLVKKKTRILIQFDRRNEDFQPCLVKKKTRILIQFDRRNEDFHCRERADLKLFLKSHVQAKCAKKSGKWAIKNLKEWYEDYNSRNPNEMCPEDILSHTCSKEVLDKWLCVFVNETQYTDMISSRIWLLLSTSVCHSLFK